jgi:hypothetical protein
MKVKVKLPLCFFNSTPRHEGVLGNGSIAPRILDFGTRWKCVVSFTIRPFYPQGNSPWYSLNRRLGRPQSRSGRSGEEKNSQLLPRLEPPIIQPVAQRYTTKLSRLLLERHMYQIYLRIWPVFKIQFIQTFPLYFVKHSTDGIVFIQKS